MIPIGSIFIRPTSNFLTTNTPKSLQKSLEYAYPPDSYTSTSQTPAMNSPKFGGPGEPETKKKHLYTANHRDGSYTKHFQVVTKYRNPKTGHRDIIAPHNAQTYDKHGNWVSTDYYDKYGNIEVSYP